MTRVLLVHGPRHGEAVEVERVSVRPRVYGRAAEPVETCEGYGPVDSYGTFDPEGLWPVHHRDTDMAKLTVAFSRDSPCLTAVEAMAIEKSSDAIRASVTGVQEAWETYCQSQRAVA